MSGTKSLSPLETRKRLLIAESEINRAQLLEDGRIVMSGVRQATDKARSLRSLASITGLAAGFLALRSKTKDSAGGKFSWFRTAIKSVKTVLPLWLAFRGRSQKN
jgi:hypothetical protein